MFTPHRTQFRNRICGARAPAACASLARLIGARSAGGVGVHHQAGAAARNMRYDGGAAMYLGDRAQVDGEGELHLLSLAQAERSGADEHTVGAQIDRAAEAALARRHHDVYRGARPMACVQTSFHELARSPGSGSPLQRVVYWLPAIMPSSPVIPTPS